MKKIKLTVCFVFLISLLFAQSGSVKGTIVNEQGLPVPYASIFLQGTKAGTHTDSLGFFTINITPDAYLIITAVGYDADTVKLNSQTDLSIVLKKNSKTLNE